MAEIINLNKYRKKKAREEKAAKADENRVKHGRRKSDKTADDTARKAGEETLDGKHLDPPEEDKPA